MEIYFRRQPSPTYTLITNGVRLTGSHGSDRYNVGIQLTGSITTAIIELTEFVDVGTWVNSGGASIWSQIDNIGVAVSGLCGTLPIKLENFIGQIDGDSAKLSWKTQSEYDVDHYEVEMSTSGIIFEKVGSRAALNLSGSVYNFDYLLENAMTYYFRLKTVDKNGTFTHSNILRLVTTKNNNAFSVNIAPVPVKDKLTINLAHAEYADVTFFDSFGKTIKQLSVTNNSTTILLETLPKGIYFIRVTNKSGDSIVKKVIVD